MKKLSILLLVFVLVTALAVSCSAELGSNDGLATISFVDSSAKKSLVASNQNYSSEADEYFVWYYTAKRAGNTNDNISTIKYGETQNLTLLGTDGKLSDSSITLSLGYWEFTLKAYLRTDVYTEGTEGTAGTYATDLTGKTAMYEAETGPVLVEKQENGNQTITVTIVNTMTSGTTGTLLVDSNIKFVNKDGDAYDSVKITDMTFTYTQLNGLTKQEDGNLTPGTGADVYSGTYKVVASYTATETANGVEGSTSVTYASTEIIVDVYDGKTTTITGTLDETTQSVTFDFKVGCKIVITENSVSNTTLETGYTYNFSPANTTYSKDNTDQTTKVYLSNYKGRSVGSSFSDGSFTLNMYDNTAMSSGEDSDKINFTVTLSDGTQYGWYFESTSITLGSNDRIIVESYIGTNLNITNFTAKGFTSSKGSLDYTVSVGQWNYDSETGCISFNVQKSN